MSWSWENAGGGALTGGAIGTMIAPGPGTAIGAGAGGLIGGFGGFGNIWDSMTGQTDPDNRFSNSQTNRSKKQAVALGTVGDWALTGNGPSAAQGLLDQNRAQNAAQMISASKSMPGGGNPALANQMASEGIARQNAAATASAATLRAQEQQQMMQNYLASLQAAREADINMYGKSKAVDVQNTENKQGFLGGLMGGGGGMIGGIL